MCVLIIKPAGAKMPARDILDACRKRNPDGCGFVSPTAKYKGLDYERFLHELSKVNDADPCIIHFRWATHGSVRPSNCHPFEAEYNGKPVYFAHNGVLSIPVVGDLTDSEVCFKTRLMPTIRHFGFKSPKVADAVFRVIGGSKFALMYDGHVRMFGHYHNIGGVYYSNLYFVSLMDNPLEFYARAV